MFHRNTRVRRNTSLLTLTIYRTRKHCHNSKNTTFQETGKTIGRGNKIASKERHFSPLAATLKNRPVTLLHYVDMVSGVPPVGITQNERFLSCGTVLLGVRCTSSISRGYLKSLFFHCQQLLPFADSCQLR
jgi:hypothetical protein